MRVGYVSGDFRHHSVAQFFEPVLRRRGHIFAVEHDTAIDCTILRQKPHQCAQGDRLSRPRLAENAEHLTAGQPETDVVYRVDRAVALLEAHREVGDVEQALRWEQTARNTVP